MDERSTNNVKKILLVTHQASSEPGLVGELLEAEGCILEICCPAVGTALPETMELHDGVVIFGGPMSANDDVTLPYLRAELDWIPIVLAAQKPFLGICLGAQMLARVLGAKVAPHPEQFREIGYRKIYPLPDAQNPLAGLNQVYHWHGEGFELPNTATLLAMGDRFTNQAFRYGEFAYGLQFHPEITCSMIQRWTTEAADQMTLPEAQSYEVQLQNHERYGVSVAQWLEKFLRQWLA